MSLLKLGLGSSLLFIGLQASAADPRLPFSCSLNPANGGGYEMLRVEGYFNPRSSAVKYSHSVTSPLGKAVSAGQGEVAYKNNGVQIEFDVLKSDNTVAKVTMSAAVLKPSGLQRGNFDTRVLDCGYLSQTFHDAGLLPASEFERYNLPAIHDSPNANILKKTFTTSDGAFSFEAILYPSSSSTKHHTVTPASTDLTLRLAGAVVDNLPDSPINIWYLLFKDGKQVQRIFREPGDVAKLKEVFGAARIEFNLVHPYGRVEPVKVLIDCSPTACEINARN